MKATVGTLFCILDLTTTCRSFFRSQFSFFWKMFAWENREPIRRKVTGSGPKDEIDLSVWFNSSNSIRPVAARETNTRRGDVERQTPGCMKRLLKSLDQLWDTLEAGWEHPDNKKGPINFPYPSDSQGKLERATTPSLNARKGDGKNGRLSSSGINSRTGSFEALNSAGEQLSLMLLRRGRFLRPSDDAYICGTTNTEPWCM